VSFQECHFVHCFTTSNHSIGGAVYFRGRNCEIADCRSDSCSAAKGNFLYISRERRPMVKSTLLFNCKTSAGAIDGKGGIYSDKDVGPLFESCNVSNCQACDEGAGGICTGGHANPWDLKFIHFFCCLGGTVITNNCGTTVLNVKYCTFVNNDNSRNFVSTSVIYCRRGKWTFMHCFFNGNTAADLASDGEGCYLISNCGFDRDVPTGSQIADHGGNVGHVRVRNTQCPGQ
jgi:hypothetical protein